MKQFILHTIYYLYILKEKKFCSGEGLEGNIRTIPASPPKNYNRHLIKEEEKKTSKYVLNVKGIIAIIRVRTLFQTKNSRVFKTRTNPVL